MLHFQHLEYLLALAAIPLMMLLYTMMVKWKKRSMKRIGDVALVKQLVKGSSPRTALIKFSLVVVAFALCAFATANLRKQTSTGKVTRKGIDVVIALDVSKSMLAEDVKPNRLERARQTVSRIIDKLKDDRIGLVIFAGRAYLQMPMTVDHSAANLYLSGISPDDVPTQGTVISQALKTSYAAFNTKERRYRSVILISDGEDHDDEAIDIAKQMASEGIMINTIGIGSPDGSTVPDPETGREKLDEEGNPVISRLNEQVLMDIAQHGNGIYQLFSTSDEVATNIYAKLSSISSTTIVDSNTADYTYYFMFFLAAALILLLIEPFIQAMNRRRKPAIAVIVSLLVFQHLNGQTTKKEIIAGNKAYNKSAYSEAVQAYERALQRSATNEVATYNLGNALYKDDKAEKAIEAYTSVIKRTADPEKKAHAWYNKGVAHHKLKQNSEAIDSYKNALKLKPTDEQARQNLQRLLQEMKQQQQKDQKDKKKDKKDQKDKKEQKDKKNEEEREPKPQPSKLNKQDAEEKLKALMQHEKDLQDKMRRAKVAGPEKPRKDW
jgi:tetratricopeptide (TPR) repeat protein